MRLAVMMAVVLAGCAPQPGLGEGPKLTAGDASRDNPRCVSDEMLNNARIPLNAAVFLGRNGNCPFGWSSVGLTSWLYSVDSAEQARGIPSGQGMAQLEAEFTQNRTAASAQAAPGSAPPSVAEIVQARREADLVQMAAARQPGLSGAIRSAAELNVDGRGRAASTRGAREAREKAIQEEEARLIQVVEAKGQAQRERAATDARYAADRQAEAVCSYRGQQTEALRPYRGLLNIDGMIANTQARAACIDMYNRTGVPPTP